MYNMPDLPDMNSADSFWSNITDFQSWSPKVWMFIAILLVLAGAYWLWNNLGSKVQLVVVVGLVITVAALFMT